MWRVRFIGLSLSLGLGVGVADTQHSHAQDTSPAATQPAAAKVGDPYTLSTDPVTGKALGNSPLVHQHDGRELRFTDQESLEAFKQDPARYLSAVDRQLTQQQLPRYPSDTCLMTGGKLGGMGEPVNHIYRNRLVRFCCAGCVAGFEKEPAKHLSKLDAAVIQKQKSSYPTDTCVVSGDKFGGDMGEPVDVVIGNRLIRVCCSGCVTNLLATPATYIEKLNAMSHRSGASEREEGATPDTGRQGHQH